MHPELEVVTFLALCDVYCFPQKTWNPNITFKEKMSMNPSHLEYGTPVMVSHHSEAKSGSCPFWPMFTFTGS